MASNVKKFWGGGLKWAGFATRDSVGYMQGYTATAPVAGNQNGQIMQQLLGVKNFPFAPVPPERATATGDDGAIGQMLFEPIDLPQGDISFSVTDLTFAALAMGVLVHDLGDTSLMPLQPSAVSYADLIFLTAYQGHDHTTGASHWSGDLIMNAQAYYQGRTNRTEREIAEFVYTMIANKSTLYPWGTALADGTNGCTEAVAMHWTHPYRPILQRWTGNNTETTFNLGANIASDAAANIRVVQAGVELTWAAGVPGAGEFGITESTTDTCVCGTAPASAAKLVAWFGTS